MKLSGGCHCGAVRFTCDGELSWAGHCHCRDCQLISGAPLVTWITVDRSAVSIEGRVRVYRSSERGVRSFCPHCSAQMFYEGTEEPGKIDIVVACLDTPDLITPERNIFVRSRLGFMKGFDAELPSFEASPAYHT